MLTKTKRCLVLRYSAIFQFILKYEIINRKRGLEFCLSLFFELGTKETEKKKFVFDLHFTDPW